MKCPFCIKQCKKCGKILVAYTGNFYKRRDRGKYGLRAECKQCSLDKQNEYYKEHKENRSNYNKQYYAENKEAIKKQVKEYRNNHKEERRIYNQKYREQNKESLSAYIKEWRENNEEKLFNYNINRRIKEENQGRGITDEQFLEMMNFFEWSCAYSGKRFSDKNKKGDRSIDHIVPINKGGLHEPWNCVPMYMPYNSSKNKKDMLEWYKEQLFFDEVRLQRIYEWQQYAYNKWSIKK